MKITSTVSIVLSLLLISISLCIAQEVVQVGVATPQTQAEEGNIEILRQRAIRNATEIAVTQVLGALISQDKEDTTHFVEVIKQKDDKIRVETKQRNRFRRSGATQITGYVRLVEIIKEWPAGKEYWVKIKVEVDEPKAATKKMGSSRICGKNCIPVLFLAHRGFAGKT